jgi:hypothetical protein
MENPVGSNISQLPERDISPFRVLPITTEDGKAEKQILTVIFGNEPIAAADEKMEMDESLADRGVLGLVEAGESG